MTKQASDALELSIAHWERLSTGTQVVGEAPYADDCDLCANFYNGECETEDRCALCPIRGKTGLPGCGGSPYAAAEKWWGSDKNKFQFKAAVMLKFLQDLRD